MDILKTFLILLLVSAYGQIQQDAGPGKYSAVWESASKDTACQMLPAKGSKIMKVFTIKNDAPYFLIANNEYSTNNGDWFKQRRLKIAMRANLLYAENTFVQIPGLETGSKNMPAGHRRNKIRKPIDIPVQNARPERVDGISWLSSWDAQFKLRWSKQTIVSGKVAEGVLSESDTQDKPVKRMWWFLGGRDTCSTVIFWPGENLKHS